MNRKSIILPLFILVALVQLFVPSKMIWDREAILREGTEIKLKTAPIDPNDPFRGKYIVLDYEENSIKKDSTESWSRGDEVFVYFSMDKDGFAKIESVSRAIIDDNQLFVKATIGNRIWNDTAMIRVDYDFNRFYMEESKAKNAEIVHREALNDTSKISYALVSIMNGDAVVKDVFIDDVSVHELAKEDN
ncbi:GDYXXLXY domain-containing protein [Carboxylicivirga caseinilyticus]|uniref:GDYXXLXY domain-containing protein n=1 Tax=Carboxylicivirga caseinilyticus TaxID=3417572 RepID=UPI003D33CD82|nr:GDYXXLXY domain-containing protein [Marinilabiliaceae bacterium A049]